MTLEQTIKDAIDAQENVAIAINMGWDLEGVLEKLQKSTNSLRAALDGLGKRKGFTPEAEEELARILND